MNDIRLTQCIVKPLMQGNWQANLRVSGDLWDTVAQAFTAVGEAFKHFGEQAISLLTSRNAKVALVLGASAGAIYGIYRAAVLVKRLKDEKRELQDELDSVKRAQEKAHDDLITPFECPITYEILKDPVIAEDGNTYERKAIEGWISKGGVSPLTQERITIEGLRPNRAIRDAIQQLGVK